jgi:heat shock protein HslJ
MQRFALVASICWLVALTGCAGDDAEQPPPVPDANPAGSEMVRDPDALRGVTWQWVGTVTPVERVEVPQPERYTLRFDGTGRVEALFDCNHGGGTYEVSANNIALGPLISTRKACPEGSLDARFMRDLGEVRSFFLEDGELFLELPVDSGTLRFRPAPEERGDGGA